MNGTRQTLLMVVAVAVFVGVGIRVTGVSGQPALSCSAAGGTPPATASPSALPDGLHRLANNGDGEALGGLSSPPPGRAATFKWAQYWVEPQSTFDVTSTGGTYTLSVTEGALQGKFCAVSGPMPLAKVHHTDGTSVDLSADQTFELRPGDIGEFRMVRLVYATGEGPTSFTAVGNQVTIGGGVSPCGGRPCWIPPFVDLRWLLPQR